MSALSISVPAKLDRPSSNDGFLSVFPAVVRPVNFVFPAWLRTIAPRDRQMALALARGDQAKQVAHQFNLSAGRVTQLRQKWRREWQIFRGQAPVAEKRAV